MKLSSLNGIRGHCVSLPVRGAWIEMERSRRVVAHPESLPVRGAWIEIERCAMALRYSASLPVRGAWIEMPCVPCIVAGLIVAPRAGSVD